MIDKYLEEAIRTYESEIDVNPNFFMDADVLMDIEDYYESCNREYDAERLMRFAERLHPDNEEVLLVKADRMKNRGLWAEALQIIADISDRDTNRSVQIILAEYEIAEGHPEKGQEVIQNILPFDENLKAEDLDLWLSFAELLMDYGYIRRAVSVLIPFPENYDHRKRVLELLADCYQQLQQLNKSIEYAEALVNAAPYDDVSWTQLAEIQIKNHLFGEAVKSCDYALAVNENSQHAIITKIWALYIDEHYAEALKLCEEYLPKFPNNYVLHMYAGELYHLNERTHESQEMLETALRLCPIDNPDHMRINRVLTSVFIEHGLHDNARELTETTCQTGVPLAQADAELAINYYSLGCKKECLDILNDLLNIKNIPDTVGMQIGEFLYNEKLFKEAKKVWKHLAKMDFSIEYPKMYAHIAFAMWQMELQREMLKAIKKSLMYCQDELVNTFGPIFSSYNLRTVLTHLAYAMNEMSQKKKDKK